MDFNQELCALLPRLRRFARTLARDPADAGKPLPRALGMHDFTLEGVTGKRAIFTFDLWMLQRALDFLRSLEGETREKAALVLKEADGERLADFPAFPRLARRNFQLVLE